MNKINCLIVDDEPIAREGLREYVTEIDFLHLAGVCRSADEAASLMKNQRIDLLFLDIEMPGLSGIQFLKTMDTLPAVILTTAYTEYAIDGFELDVIDYLLKPVSFPRFSRAVQKAADFLQASAGNTGLANPVSNYFFIKVNSRFEKIFFEEVLYIEALQNYVSVHLADKKMLSYIPISSLEKQLPASQFMRVHKSYLVSLSKIRSMQGNSVFLGNIEIPVSRKIKDSLQKVVLTNSLLKR